MLTDEQIAQVEHSFKHGDTLVFVVANLGVFVADKVNKHKNEGTVEMKECYQVDEACFLDGDYNGDVSHQVKKMVLKDPYKDTPCLIATRYEHSEIMEVR